MLHPSYFMKLAAQFLAVLGLWLAGCASTPPEKVVTSEMRKDVKADFDLRIAQLSELEHRLAHVDTETQLVEILEFVGTSSHSAYERNKLLLERYPALRVKQNDQLPPAIRPEFERGQRLLREKTYVCISLKAEIDRFKSQPEVQKAMLRLRPAQ